MARSDEPNLWRMSHMGLEFALAMFVVGAAGYWVDGKLETGPWGMVVGGLIGLIGGFYLLIREVLAANRQLEKKRADTDQKEM